ncbi:SCO0930 family lipoprotein [Actinomadura sp. 21ATH]|uniref:SCO0930 family lipoprotein n=1 Tax=Actinomadura sp. 21ATH TaxID=1735444 RepID=UPI0035BFABE4
MEFPRWAVPVVAVVAGATTLTACGQEPVGQNAGAGARQSPAADPSADAGEEPPAVRPASLEVAEVDRLGRVVTDREGRTLYRFDKDTARPPASTCEDACADAWPPVMTGQGEVEVKGVDQNLVGKVRRPDGAWQVTLGGWPLYRYAKDREPGDAKGQGVGGTWYASAPDGKKAEVPDRAPANGQDGDEGGRWAGWTVVKVRQDPRYGPIVTDGKGRVMYRFDKDRVRKTNCFGDCKKAWPPVKFTNWKKVKVEGVDRDLVGFIERAGDPACQLTIDGRPMYYFAKDREPGDTAGQGVQDVWWLVSARGEKITTAPDGGGGYGGY